MNAADNHLKKEEDTILIVMEGAVTLIMTNYSLQSTTALSPYFALLRLIKHIASHPIW
jgi:hypothetical protein